MKKSLFITILMIIALLFGAVISMKCIEKKYTRDLICAIEKNDIAELSNLLRKKISKNEKPYFIGNDRRNYHAITVASEIGNIEAVKLLIENGTKVNVVGTNGQTPLLMAIKSNSINKYDIIYYLIEKGAKINQTNKTGNSAICELIYTNKNDNSLERFRLFQYLLENNAEIYSSSPYGCIVFDACINNDIQIVKYLFDTYSLNVNMKSKIKNTTLLMLTTYRDSIEVCEFLIKNGADKSLRNNDGKTAYDLAIENNCIKTVELLK